MNITINKNEFETICDKINWSETTPTKENILNSIKHTKNIKVVILGQDPYPMPGVANGFAFAVNKNVAIPASLIQIFNEIKKEFQIIKTDRTLMHWVKQGVLLLNTSLTTKINNPGSHFHLWENFTKKIVQQLQTDKNIIWILWGKIAKSYKYLIIDNNKIIEDAHPSPLSIRWRKGDTFAKIRKISTITW